MRPDAIVLAVLAALALAGSAFAQVPPHNPGTICITPSGWCWADYQGTPGSPCGCTTSEGYVSGSLG